MSESRVAVIIVSHEVLTGKIRDENGAYAARRLSEAGAPPQKLIFVPADLTALTQTVKDMRGQYDIVIIGGGTGSTADDITKEAVARALGQKLQRHTYLATLVSRHFEGANLTAAQSKLALIPEKAQLLVQDAEEFPLVYVDNIYMLPGHPDTFKGYLERMLKHVVGQPRFMEEVKVEGDETRLAPAIKCASHAYPGVKISSNPLTAPNQGRCEIKVTFEAVDELLPRLAKESLIKNLSSEVKLISQ